jgi:hypothetical protein
MNLRLLFVAATLCLAAWVTPTHAIPASERAALVALYNGTNGAAWTNTVANDQVWTVAAAPGNECAWFGVACSAGDANVTGIDLPGNNLAGSLPATLNQLTALELLKIEGNQLTGTLPSLTGLAALRGFEVYSNQLSGAIPSLTGLTALERFDARNNQLTGALVRRRSSN